MSYLLWIVPHNVQAACSGRFFCFMKKDNKRKSVDGAKDVGDDVATKGVIIGGKGFKNKQFMSCC